MSKTCLCKFNLKLAFAVCTHKLRIPEVGVVTVEFQLQYFVDARHSNRIYCSRIIFGIQDTVIIYCSGIFLVQDTVTRYLLLKTICFCNILLSYTLSRFLRLLRCVLCAAFVIFLLFSFFSRDKL